MIRATAGLAALTLFAGAAMAATVVPPTDVAYENGAVAEPLTETPGDPERGRQVVSDKSLGNCVSCHSASDLKDVPWHGGIGPTFDGVGARWDEASLRGIVANAKEMFPGSMMPSFYKTEGFIRPGEAYTGEAAEGEIEPILTAQQIEDVVAYLMTLKD